MKYILIIVYIFSSHGVTITTAEYNNKEACIKAGETFKSEARILIGSVYYSCSEKGE